MAKKKKPRILIREIETRNIIHEIPTDKRGRMLEKVLDGLDQIGQKVSAPCAYCKKEKWQDSDSEEEHCTSCDGTINPPRHESGCPFTVAEAIIDLDCSDDMKALIAAMAASVHNISTAVENVASRLTEIDKTIQSLTHEGGLAVHCFKE